MPTPPFITALRRHIGHAPLWLIGTAAVVLRPGAVGQEVLLVRRADTGEWSLVSGIVDPGEHPVDTIIREAKEETGTTIEVERMLWMVVDPPITYPNGDQCQFLDHGFLAHWRAGEAHVGDDESTEVGWFPADALPHPQRRGLERMVAIATQPEQGLLFTLDEAADPGHRGAP